MRIQGNTADQKFKSVEKALQRLSKKISNKRTSIITPATPLSFYISEVPEDEIVVRYMFPAQGTLTRVVVMIPELAVGKETLNLDVTLVTETGAVSQGFYVKSRKIDELVDHPVEPGDRMFIKADKAPVWLGLIYQVNPSGREINNARVQEDTGIESGSETLPEGDEETGTS